MRAALLGELIALDSLSHYESDCPFYAMRLVKGNTFKEAIKPFLEADKTSKIC